MNIQRLSWSALVWILVLAAAVSQLSLASAAEDFDGLVAAIRAANSTGSRTIALSGDIVLSAALPAIYGKPHD